MFYMHELSDRCLFHFVVININLHFLVLFTIARKLISVRDYFLLFSPRIACNECSSFYSLLLLFVDEKEKEREKRICNVARLSSLHFRVRQVNERKAILHIKYLRLLFQGEFISVTYATLGFVE